MNPGEQGEAAAQLRYGYDDGPGWGPWGTLGLSTLVMFIFLSAHVVVTAIYIGLLRKSQGTVDLASLQTDGLLVSLATVGASAAGGLALLTLVGLRVGAIGEYLAMRRPRLASLLLTTGALLLLTMAAETAVEWSGHPTTPAFVVETFRSAGSLPLFVFAVLIAAPVFEEALFRGFMYPGLASTPLGSSLGIVIPAILWASIHFQYGSVYRTYIFVLGLFFGWVRHRTGSTVTCMILHGVTNLAALYTTWQAAQTLVP